MQTTFMTKLFHEVKRASLPFAWQLFLLLVILPIGTLWYNDHYSAGAHVHRVINKYGTSVDLPQIEFVKKVRLISLRLLKFIVLVWDDVNYVIIYTSTIFLYKLWRRNARITLLSLYCCKFYSYNNNNYYYCFFNWLLSFSLSLVIGLCTLYKVAKFMFLLRWTLVWLCKRISIMYIKSVIEKGSHPSVASLPFNCSSHRASAINNKLLWFYSCEIS